MKTKFALNFANAAIAFALIVLPMFFMVASFNGR